MRLPSKNTKDQLRNFAKANGPAQALEPSLTSKLDRPPCGQLEFWTYHPNEVEPANFAVFGDGEYDQPPGQSSRWGGPFSGRPQLIAEIFPVLKSNLAGKAVPTVTNAYSALRDWWRLLDNVEKSGAKTVRSVADLTDLHRQRAFDVGMRSKHFSWFINVIVNPTRATLSKLGICQVEQLYWNAPERPTPGAAGEVLPSVEMVDPIRVALKHGWFAALHRWERTELLLSLGRPLSLAEAGLGNEDRLDEAGRRKNSIRLDEELLLLKQYQHYQTAMQVLGGRVPYTTREVLAGLSARAFREARYSIKEMQRGFFPDGEDIRMAFMLCLTATGWNPQVLLDLDATKSDEFIVEHPRNDPDDDRGRQYLMKSVSDDANDAEADEEDGSSYLMKGWKERAKHEVYTEGLKKSRASAPVIVLSLIKRTAPLRERLRERLAQLRTQYHNLQAQDAGVEVLHNVHKEIAEVQQGIRSPWLFFAQGRLLWLNKYTYDANGDRYLRSLISTLNARRSADRQLPYIVPTDFRKIYGNYWYRKSSGDILQVQKALGHLKVKTTEDYLSDNGIRQQSDQNWRVFLQHLWSGIQTGRVDPTLLAKLCQDGKVAEVEMQQLVDYRKLQRSRIGVPCKDPHNPPKSIDPTFTPDGENMCVAQRCTLCRTNAVLAPDSWPGLCMRLAELRYLQTELPIEVFSTAGSFHTELANTERAMLAFPDQPIEEHVKLWTQRIANEEHLPPELL